MKCERIYRISEKTYKKAFGKKQVDLSVGCNKHFVAIIVQWLFSKPASSEIFHAKWGAGDILTYASTVALGLLAVWQNQKFKEENDKSQERLEKLTRQANELAIIGKIIDNRSAKLQRLQKCFSEFELVSSVGDISTMSTGVKDFDELQSHLTERTLDLISKSQYL